MGVFKEIKYKFEEENILNSYKKMFDYFEKDKIFFGMDNIRTMFSFIADYYNLGIELKNIENTEIISKISDLLSVEISERRKEKNVYYNEKEEKIKLEYVINYFKILKLNLEKDKEAKKNNIENIGLESWKKLNNEKKIKVLIELDRMFEEMDQTLHKEMKSHIEYEKIKKQSDSLKKYLEIEGNDKIILEMADTIRKIEYSLVEIKIINDARKIKEEKEDNIIKEKKGELIHFINKKLKEERLQYMFDRKYWGGWTNEVEKIGIVEKEGKWIIKPQEE